MAFALQGKIDDHMYMGFGVSPSGGMIGSDVTITGVLDGQAYAIDYYLFGLFGEGWLLILQISRHSSHDDIFYTSQSPVQLQWQF